MAIEEAPLMLSESTAEGAKPKSCKALPLAPVSWHGDCECNLRYLSKAAVVETAPLNTRMLLVFP